MPSRRNISFRPASHGDAAFAAKAQSAADPLHPKQESEILEAWRSTEEGADVRRFVVQVDGIDAGWTSLVKARDSTADFAWLNLIIPGEAQDVIEAAATFTEGHAGELGAGLLISSVWEVQTAAIRALKRQGWEQKRLQRFWRLDLEPNSARLLELRGAARRRVESQGLRMASAAELGGVAIYPDLHAVSETTVADIPSSVPIPVQSYAAWLAWMEPPSVLPERVWVAVADGRPVGYSLLTYRPSLVETGYTGVIREHRNKGVARALKLETLAQAIELGVQAVETDNDFENAPILHLNAELGYRAIAVRLEFHKPIAPKS